MPGTAGEAGALEAAELQIAVWQHVAGEPCDGADGAPAAIADVISVLSPPAADADNVTDTESASTADGARTPISEPLQKESGEERGKGSAAGGTPPGGMAPIVIEAGDGVEVVIPSAAVPMGDAGGCSLGIAIEDPDRVSVPSNASAAAAGTVAEPSSAPPAAHARAVEAAPIKSENLQFSLPGGSGPQTDRSPEQVRNRKSSCT